MTLALVGDLDCDIIALPTPPPSQVSPSCNFGVIQSVQHQKQLVYINQHMSPSIKFARSPTFKVKYKKNHSEGHSKLFQGET